MNEAEPESAGADSGRRPPGSGERPGRPTRPGRGPSVILGLLMLCVGVSLALEGLQVLRDGWAGALDW